MIAAPPQKLRNRVIGIYGFLGCFNLGAWIWAFLAFYDRPVLLGTAFLAYTFGLRHAVDADHITAIDNVTRMLYLHVWKTLHAPTESARHCYGRLLTSRGILN